jgi:hypothetical protein
MTWFRRRPHVPERTGTQPYRDTSTKVVDPIMEEINREFRRMQGHPAPESLEKPNGRVEGKT